MLSDGSNSSSSFFFVCRRHRLGVLSALASFVQGEALTDHYPQGIV